MDTEVTDTPASCATSRMVGVLIGIPVFERGMSVRAILHKHLAFMRYDWTLAYRHMGPAVIISSLLAAVLAVITMMSISKLLIALFTDYATTVCRDVT